jgi:hypothetical protein
LGQFAHALDLAEEAGDDEPIAGVHYRLGRVFLHYNALSRASAEFELGERAAQRRDSALALSILCVNQAWRGVAAGATVEDPGAGTACPSDAAVAPGATGRSVHGAVRAGRARRAVVMCAFMIKLHPWGESG